MSFLGEFLRDPRSVGAVAPSGRQLAQQMVAAAEVSADHVVVELGAGTGSFTAELLRVVSADRFVALEPNLAFAERLAERFPGIRFEPAMAQGLRAVLERHSLARVDRVVSGLPFALWSDEVQQDVLTAVIEVLNPGGRLVTFGYLQSQILPAARRFRRRLQEQFVEVEVASVAWWNLPPAMVWVCKVQ